MISRRTFLGRFLIAAGLAPLVARAVIDRTSPPNRGDAVPIVTTGLVRMADGTLINLRPTGALWIIQTPDGCYHGGRATWDRAAGAFRADKPLPTVRRWIETPPGLNPQPQRLSGTLLSP